MNMHVWIAVENSPPRLHSAFLGANHSFCDNCSNLVVLEMAISMNKISISNQQIQLNKDPRTQFSPGVEKQRLTASMAGVNWVTSTSNLTQFLCCCTLFRSQKLRGLETPLATYLTIFGEAGFQRDTLTFCLTKKLLFFDTGRLPGVYVQFVSGTSTLVLNKMVYGQTMHFGKYHWINYQI